MVLFFFFHLFQSEFVPHNLGEHILPLKQECSWEFRENLWQTTLFWCDFSSNYGKLSFEVFWPKNELWLQERCNYWHCIWRADKKGFSLYNGQTNVYSLLCGSPASLILSHWFDSLMVSLMRTVCYAMAWLATTKASSKTRSLVISLTIRALC